MIKKTDIKNLSEPKIKKGKQDYGNKGSVSFKTEVLFQLIPIQNQVWVKVKLEVWALLNLVANSLVFINVSRVDQ